MKAYVFFPQNRISKAYIKSIVFDDDKQDKEIPPPSPKKLYGSLSLASDNVEGDVYIDDILYQNIEKGTTMYEDQLKQGDHIIKIKNRDRTMWTRKFYITANKTIYLTAYIDIPEYGSLSLASDNVEGDVYIDNIQYQYISKGTTIRADQLTPGNHTVKIKSHGKILWSKEFYITANKTKNITAHTDTPSLSPILQRLVDNMVYVQGGTFTMGCTSEQGSDCDGDEKPPHRVTLSDYYIGKYEVTQEEWREVMGSDPPELRFKGCDKCPVERVSWNDVQEFIKKLNQKTGKHFRLPTEAEWEYAAREGNRSKGYKYSGSNNISSVAWYGDNSGSKTHEVGSKSPNELGLYDMSGNVWEWCSDWYDENYYSNSRRSNPKGPSTGSYRVFRGGSWSNDARYCRSANRFIWFPDSRHINVGFRLAHSLPR